MDITSPHFSQAELRCRGTNCNLNPPLLPVRGCGENRCTQTLVDGLEAFRVKALELYASKPGYHPVDFPGVRIIDAYRCLKHNAGTTGAVSDSQHPNGRAADISVSGLSSAELEECALAVPVFNEGGIGRDDIRGMIHVDCRPTKARWCYYRNAQGVIKWGAYSPPVISA